MLRRVKQSPIGANSKKLFPCREALIVANEPLCGMTPILHAAKLLHSLMGWIERCLGFLAGVGETSRTLTIFSLGDIHVVGRFKVLSLSAGFNFVVEQAGPPPAL